MNPFKALIGQKAAPVLGVDVSSNSIKLVELSHGGDGEYSLEACAVEPLERGWIVDGGIDKFDEVASALRRVVKKSGARNKSIAMALPTSAVISKKLVLPAGMSDQEMEIQVEAEAGRYVPFPLDEVYLDFCIVGPNANSADDVDVFMAAARREKVQERQGLAEAAGLKLQIIEVESNASRIALNRLVEMLSTKAQEPVVALFEIGSQSTGMQVLRGDEILYERDQSFGGAQLTQQIAKHYGFPLEEAESRKRSGKLPNDCDTAVIKNFVSTLSQEISRALQFFFNSTPHNRVDHVFLAGGSAALPGLAEAVAGEVSFPCGIANPFQGMGAAGGVSVKKISRELPGYLAACGLAMRSA